MYCKSCGTPVEENARFCTVCGAALCGDTKNAVMQVPETELPKADQKQRSRDALWVMIFGIISTSLGLICGYMMTNGLSLVSGYFIPGVIFGFIGLRCANNYVKKYGESCTNVRIGRCLSKAGVTYAFICMTIILLFILLCLFLFALYLLIIAVGMAGGWENLFS